MTVFPSAPAQTLSPRAPPNRRIQRAALTAAPMMMMKKRNIAASWQTKPAEATTVPRNTTTLNSNTQSPINCARLCWDVSCACHYRTNECASSCCVSKRDWHEPQIKHMRYCLPQTHIHAIYKSASFYTCNVFIWNFSVYFISACSVFLFLFLHAFVFFSTMPLAIRSQRYTFLIYTAEVCHKPKVKLL